MTDLLGPEGPLARLPGFAARPQQQEMAEAVAECLAGDGVLVAEAGTGTGKTYAYLVPALSSGQKVMISTGTKTLQDQLFHRDIPMLRKVLGVGGSVALLKGRGNYLCWQRLDQHEHAGRYQVRQHLHQLGAIRRWASQTRSGDIAELDTIPEDAPVWSLATSTRDNCQGTECPRFNDCFVMKARKAAQEADLLVVNHHLFFADMAVREEGFGEVLPGVHAFIFDEAHQLAEVASQFFGTAVSGRQLQELARDAHIAMLADAPDQTAIENVGRILEKCVQDFRLAFGVDARRASWDSVRNKTAVADALTDVRDALQELIVALEAAQARAKSLEQCWRRCTEMQQRLELFTTAGDDAGVRWFETHERGVTLRLTPIDIAPNFHAYMEGHGGAWIFTSATLTAGGSFEHFSSQLGIDGAVMQSWDSPFDFRRQALLYLPQGLPEPNHPGFTAAVGRLAIDVIKASRGRAFLLVTSWRALREAADMLRAHVDYPLLVQGEAPRGELLERFRQIGNAVLIGTGSFWEGVDVKGEALSCVIIDKLPFAAPDDPVLQARAAAMQAHGGNAFMDYQLPRAVISLKQGVGRLIRDSHDRGVLVLCDPRLLNKAYGRVFLQSLPDMIHTRSLNDVQNFFTPETA